MLSQNCARSLSALCARFVAERAQSLSSVFPRFSLAAAFAAGRSLLSSSSAQLTCRSCEAFALRILCPIIARLCSSGSGAVSLVTTS